jgi:hypothetical protein
MRASSKRVYEQFNNIWKFAKAFGAMDSSYVGKDPASAVCCCPFVTIEAIGAIAPL